MMNLQRYQALNSAKVFTRDATGRLGRTNGLTHTTLLSLPDEVLLRIMALLGWRDYFALDNVCCRFRQNAFDTPEHLSLVETAAKTAALGEVGATDLLAEETWKLVLGAALREKRLLPSGLCEERVQVLRGFCQKTGAQLARNFDSTVTHIVTHTDGPTRVAQKRWLKILQGIMQGCWVVSYDWVVASETADRWVLEHAYEAHLSVPAGLRGYEGFVAENGCLAGPREARKSRGPGLFVGERFFLAGEFVAPRLPREALVQLVESGGGVVLDKDGDGWRSGQFVPPRRGRDSVHILVSISAEAEEVNAVQDMWGRQPLQINWLMDSISAYQLCPPGPYLLPDCNVQGWTTPPPRKKHRSRSYFALFDSW
ncbi:hypothetical protein CYMTET_40008 [Cymbomonas tetramitiformis]|uniref:BRCT domain-containing protein n=1 Tax=Cymbomonas tetramitiformis TaxID=36881 RepID=A0AAE0C8W9_9CHLO|nr:hypothetical protein CYMTET_40008 [Cymbomonas tetramitiformis]